MDNIPKGKKIILFDGVCNLCNSTINRIIDEDKLDQFRFASLDSAIGQEILTYIGVDRNNTDSIVLYEPGIAYYVKSEAAFKIASYLGGWYSLVCFFNLFPTKLNDLGYEYVAKNRYKWYGKKDSCMIPTAEIKRKFL